MPHRPRSHVVGDIALSRVAAICNDLGWTCEAIHKDYGEDLWVQTTVGDIVDHHRIWFQVKGTDNIERYKNKRGVISYVVDVNHAMRWVRSIELVVVVLWDIKADAGYWTLPKDNFTDWDLWDRRIKTVKLVFKKKNRFNSSAAHHISKIARSNFYNTLLARVQPLKGRQALEKKWDFLSPVSMTRE